LPALQFLLPAFAVGYRSSALIMRITRSSMLGVLRDDYVRTAWAKGQTGRVVIWRHALKNAILPVVTVIGIEFAFLIGGLVVTETSIQLPGVARCLVQAIIWRDYPIVQNLVMFTATVVILSNLLVDMMYGWLDPRVKYADYQADETGASASLARCASLRRTTEYASGVPPRRLPPAAVPS